MIFEEASERSAGSCATTPRPSVVREMAFVSDTVAPDVSICLRWVRASVRVGVPVFLALIAIASLPGAWSDQIRGMVSPAAAAASSALAVMLFATIPRSLDSSDPGGAGRQAAIQGLMAVAAATVLVATLFGWIACPSWVIVAGATLAWFGSLLMSVRELADTATRLGSWPDVVTRLDRRARSGAIIWLVGLAAIGMAAAVALIASGHGTDAFGGRDAATVHFGDAFVFGRAFAVARLLAIALSGYACIGLAYWAIVFEVASAGITAGVRERSPSIGSR